MIKDSEKMEVLKPSNTNYQNVNSNNSSGVLSSPKSSNKGNKTPRKMTTSKVKPLTASTKTNIIRGSPQRSSKTSIYKPLTPIRPHPVNKTSSVVTSTANSSSKQTLAPSFLSLVTPQNSSSKSSSVSTIASSPVSKSAPSQLIKPKTESVEVSENSQSHFTPSNNPLTSPQSSSPSPFSTGSSAPASSPETPIRSRTISEGSPSSLPDLHKSKNDIDDAWASCRKKITYSSATENIQSVEPVKPPVSRRNARERNRVRQVNVFLFLNKFY